MTEFEPFRAKDCLLVVDILRFTLQAHKTPEGCLSPHGLAIVSKALESLEMKLGGERRGPVAVPGEDGRKPR